MPRTPHTRTSEDRQQSLFHAPEGAAPEGAAASPPRDDRPDERAGETGAPWEPGRSPAGDESRTNVVPRGGYPSATPERSTPEEEAKRGHEPPAGSLGTVDPEQPMPGNRDLPK